jgi:hypothetical protein
VVNGARETECLRLVTIVHGRVPAAGDCNVDSNCAHRRHCYYIDAFGNRVESYAGEKQ